MGNTQTMSSFKALHIDLHKHIHQRRVKPLEETIACTYKCMTLTLQQLNTYGIHT